MQAELTWAGKMRFDATAPGIAFTFHSPEEGEEQAGPTPMEGLLASIAACTAMDVISILQKKRQVIRSYRIEVEGDRPPDGEWPRPFTSVSIKHFIQGEGVDPAAVERAIELSESKYCSVAATLRETPTIVNTWEISSSTNSATT